MRAVVVLILTMLAAAPATAAVLTSDEASQYQKWTDDSLVPTPKKRIRLSLKGCTSQTGTWSCALPNAVISIAPQDHGNQAVFLHELGHQVDFLMAHRRDRQRYRQIVGCRNRWRAYPVGCQELWATSWGLCARYIALPDQYETQYEFRPTPTMHKYACRLFRRLD